MLCIPFVQRVHVVYPSTYNIYIMGTCKKSEMGLQLLVAAKTINYCSRQLLCQTKVQQPNIEALFKFCKH